MRVVIRRAGEKIKVLCPITDPIDTARRCRDSRRGEKAIDVDRGVHGGQQKRQRLLLGSAGDIRAIEQSGFPGCESPRRACTERCVRRTRVSTIPSKRQKRNTRPRADLLVCRLSHSLSFTLFLSFSHSLSLLASLTVELNPKRTG